MISKEQIIKAAHEQINGNFSFIRYDGELNKLVQDMENAWEYAQKVREQINEEAMRILNPYGIKIGIGHLRQGTKFRIYADMSDMGTKHNAVIYEVTGIHRTMDGHHVVQTTAPCANIEGLRQSFGIGWIAQIVEAGTGPLLIDDGAKLDSRYFFFGEDSYYAKELGLPLNTRKRVYYSVRDSVVWTVANMGIPRHSSRVIDMQAMVSAAHKETWMKEVTSPDGYLTCAVWSKKKLKKWVKKNTQRFLWTNKKQAALDAEMEQQMYADMEKDLERNLNETFRDDPEPEDTDNEGSCYDPDEPRSSLWD